MANHASHGALPFPVKGARYSILVPYLDADGDPTDPVTPDTEVSKDAGAFVDCTEEVTVIGGINGLGYITFTGDEMNASIVGIAAKVASGPKNTLATLTPRVLPVLHAGTAQAGAAGSITLQTTAFAIDKFYIGCIVRTTGGTGGGGGVGALNNQARVITDYTSGRVATVVPAWETAPDATTTYEILATDLAVNAFRANLKTWLDADAATPTVAGVPEVDLTHWRGTAVPAEHTAGYPIVTVKDGTGTGEIDTASGKVAADLQAIAGNVGGPSRLDRSTRAIVKGTVTTGATTSSLPTSSLDPAVTVADQLKGRIVIFDDATTTAALRGQATDITANTNTGTLTVTALTTAPVSGDTFVIL